MKAIMNDEVMERLIDTLMELKEIGGLSQNRQDGQAACEAKDAGTD